MMLAAIGKKEILKSKDYLFEPKLDGYRALCIYKKNKITLKSRTGRDITKDYPELDFKLKKDCVIDGEIVMYDMKGNPSFSLMQKRKFNEKDKATFVAFDIVELKGKNSRNLKLSQRRELLESVVILGERLQITPTTDDGEKLWEVVAIRNLEGVIAKRKDSKYIEGRSRDWLKIKNELTADCVIIGYKTKIRTIASLSLGLYDNQKIKYIGQVGTGFTESFLKELYKKLKFIQTNTKSTLPDLPKDIIAVHPLLVCEVKYLELTQDMRLRAPVFLKLREDKMPTECTMEQVIRSA
jgi:bifunctional non-homologous end joining protein LigD